MMKEQIPTLLKTALLTAVVLWGMMYDRTCFADASANAFLNNNYIYDKNFAPAKRTAANNENPFLAESGVTADALDLFRTLERKYAVNSLAELGRHDELVLQDLLARFKEADARALHAYYQKYLDCQISIVNDNRFRTRSLDPQELLVLLSSIQSFRREKLGRDTADALFGPEVKEREYLLRRLIIIGRPDQYGKEKETGLQKLKDDMWGDKVASIEEDTDPYNRYQLKLQLYARDLSEMDEHQQKLKTEQFRREYFTQEQIDRIKLAEAEVAADDENLKRYRIDEKKIQDAAGMSQARREQAIRMLQDRYFGSEADAFRRREAIKRNLEVK